ncbi:MAG: hypothetical protein AMXMBFR33_19190 [Candidatus Xenobia bacterium]
MNVQGIAWSLPPAQPILPQASGLPGTGPTDLVELARLPVASAGPETRSEKPEKPAGPVKQAESSEPAESKSSVPIRLTQVDETSQVPRTDPLEAWTLQLRRSYRREEIPALVQLRSQLLDGKLEGKEFQQAAGLLVDLTHHSEDQLTSRIARRILFDRFRWPDTLDDLKAKVGHPQGCTQQLRDMLHGIDGHSADRTYHTEESVGLLLSGLEDAVPDQETIRVVARVGRGFYQRSKAELTPEIREHESHELDRTFAQRADRLLQKWHKEGHFTWEGETSLELGRVEVWPGPMLKILPEEKETRPESTGLHKQLDRWKEEERHVAQDKLAELWRKDRPEAERLIERLLIDLDQPGREGSRRMTVALGGAARHPELKAAFAPHLGTLTGHVGRAQARDELASNNLVGAARVDFVRNLAAAFPQAVTEEWYRGEVLPLVLAEEINTRNGAAVFVEGLFKEHPDLRDLTMQAVTAYPNDFYLEHCCRSALGAAVKTGWQPTAVQKDWLVSWLHVPYEPEKKDGPSPHSSNDGFRAAVNATSALLEKDSGALEGCELPNTRGQMVSVAEALFDRLAQQDFPSTDSYRRQRNSELYRILESDPGLKERVFQKAEEDYRAAGSLVRLDGTATRSLQLLGELAQQPSDQERLATLLSQEDTRSNGVFHELVNRVVRIPERARLAESLGEEGVTAAQVVAQGTRSVLLALRQDPHASWSKVTEALSPVQQAASGCSPVALQEQGRNLAERLLPRLSACQNADELSLQLFSEVAVLGALAAKDAGVRKMLEPLSPELDRLADGGWNSSLRAVHEAIPQMICSALAEQIEETASPDEQRGLVQEALPWPKALHTVLESWSAVWKPPAEGQGNLGWLERGFACRTQPELRAEWVKESLQLSESQAWPEGTSYASWYLCPKLQKDALKILQQPGPSLEERSAALSLAHDLGKLTGEGPEKLKSAFEAHATEWEKDLLAAHGEHFSEAVSTCAAVASTRGDREQNWKQVVAPILARLPSGGYPHLAEAVRLSGDLPGELKAHLDDFSYLLGRLGPESSGEALSVFIQLKQLEGEGVAREDALRMALAAYLNPGGEVEVASGVRETQSSVLMGGINLRKKARS